MLKAVILNHLRSVRTRLFTCIQVNRLVLMGGRRNYKEDEQPVEWNFGVSLSMHARRSMPILSIICCPLSIVCLVDLAHTMLLLSGLRHRIELVGKIRPAGRVWLVRHAGPDHVLNAPTLAD